MLVTSGRRSGKTWFPQELAKVAMEATEYYARNYIKYDTAKVDDADWTTTRCNKAVSEWIRLQNNNYWYEHKNGECVFDLHEKLLTLLEIKWT